MKRYFIIALLLLSVLAMGCAEQEKIISEPVKATPKPAPEPEKTYKPAPAPEPEPEPEPSLSGEDKAIEVAKDYVKNLDGYKNQDGRKLTVTSVVESGCKGCWIVDVKYERDKLYYPDESEDILMSLYIEDWKVDRYDMN